MKINQDVVLTTKKIVETGIGQWDIKISGKTWSQVIETAKKAVINQLQIPGFRKGKIPNQLAARHLTEAAILKQAANKAPKIAYDYAINQKDLAVKANGQPEIEIKAISLTECEMLFTFDLPLEVKIKQLAGYEIAKTPVKITKKEIDQQIKALKDRFAVFSPKETGVVETGDIAIFDFKGTINGQEFDGNQGKDTNLEIGSNNFIPGFEDQLIGMKPNTEKVIKVKFPKNYHVEKLANQAAEFHINLKAIKNKIVSDDLEELAKDLNNPNVKTADDLLKFVEQQLQVEKNRTVRDEFLNAYVEAVAADSTFVFPQSVIKKETERLVDDFKQQLLKQNVAIEEYKKITGLSDQDISREATKDAIWQLQSYFITEEIIKQYQLKPTADEIDNYLNMVSQQTKMSVAELKTKVPDLTFIENGITRQKAIDWIWDNNGPKIADSKAAEPAAASQT